jgi:hypothetical protein
MQMSRGVTASRIYGLLTDIAALPVVVSGNSCISIPDDHASKYSAGGSGTFWFQTDIGRYLRIRHIEENGPGNTLYLFGLPDLSNFSTMYVYYGIASSNPPSTYNSVVGLFPRSYGSANTILNPVDLGESLAIHYGTTVAKQLSVKSNTLAALNYVSTDLKALGVGSTQYYLYFENLVSDYGADGAYQDLNVYDVILRV